MKVALNLANGFFEVKDCEGELLFQFADEDEVWDEAGQPVSEKQRDKVMKHPAVVEVLAKIKDGTYAYPIAQIDYNQVGL